MRRALLVAVALAGAAHADTSSGIGDDAAMRALVDKWLDAQNRGDFAAYRALYAAGFHGVRRSGGRTVVLDRDAWLRDRERMFKKPMKVTAADLQVARAGGVARASFVQQWASGSYADRGRKEIDAVTVGGALLIAREELLASERLGAPVSAAAAPAGEPAEDRDCPTAKAAPFTGTFRGEPGWLVLGETSDDAGSIAARALKLEADGIEAHPIGTDAFANLKPGLFAIVHGAFATREEAEAHARALGERRIRASVKQSGALRGGHPLVEIRGTTSRNGQPGRYPVEVTTGDGGEGAITPAAGGAFVWWTSGPARLHLRSRAPLPEQHNSSSPADVCVTLAAGTRGRVDVGELETTTWFCGY